MCTSTVSADSLCHGECIDMNLLFNIHYYLQKLNLLLIFWVLFCGKMIYQFSLKSSKEDERKNSGDGESKREDSTSYDKSILDQRITKQSTRRKKAARR